MKNNYSISVWVNPKNNSLGNVPFYDLSMFDELIRDRLWHHIAVVSSGEEKSYYLDGKKVEVNKFFEGEIDDVVFHKKPLTKDEIKEIVKNKYKTMKIGDTVRAYCTAIGRYIGNGKCVYISAMTNDRVIDDVNYKDNNKLNLPIVNDEELKKYINK